MPLYNDNIKNYFKPFATTQTSQKKRPLSEDVREEPRTVKRFPLNRFSECQPLEQEKDFLLQEVSSLGDASGENDSLSSSQPPVPTSSQVADSTPTLPLPTPEETETQSANLSATLTHSQDETPSRMPNIAGSQTVLTSSQRVVKNGEVMIRNSDDESDSSLEDLDDLIARNPSPESSPPLLYDVAESTSKTWSSRKTGDGSKRRTRRSARVGEPASPLRSTLPVLPKPYKFSLELLANQSKQYEASNEGVAQALSVLQSFDQRQASSREQSRPLDNKGSIEADLISRVIKDHGDEDDVGRLQAAFQRTEALQYSKSWSFFDDHFDNLLFERKFPEVKDERLKPVLDEKIFREQAFLGGFMREYGMKTSLPEEVLLWILDEMCFETRDDLRFSYTDALKQATSQLLPLLDPECINALFRKLGASSVATDIEESVVPRAVLSPTTDYSSRPCLLSVLDLLGVVAGGLTSECRTHVLCMSCRLALDHSIVKDIHAINAVGSLFSRLVESCYEEGNEYELQTGLTKVFHSVNDANLRLQLLQVIPPFPQLVAFRQQLALAFFFEDLQYLSKQPEDLVDFRSIADRLQDPQFTIDNATDYAELAASIGILSIAIGCGNPPSPSSTEDEVIFNSDVDILATKVRAMFTQIIDTSASQMKRTEAKEILESFHSRLLFAVRTRPPPKKSVFGDSVAKSQAGDMDAYVMRSKETDRIDIPNG